MKKFLGFSEEAVGPCTLGQESSDLEKAKQPAFEVLTKNGYAGQIVRYFEKLVSQKFINVEGSSIPYTLLLGDSFNRHGLPAAGHVTREKNDSSMARLWYTWTPGCATFPQGEFLIHRGANTKRGLIPWCIAARAEVRKILAEKKPYTKILTLRWEGYVYTDEKLAFVSTQIAALWNMTSSLVLVGSPPTPSYDILSCLWQVKGQCDSDETRKQCPPVFKASESYFKAEQKMRKILEMNPGVKYMNGSKTGLCTTTSARNVECKAWNTKKGPLFYDMWGHLTLAGGEYIAAKLSEYFSRP